MNEICYRSTCNRDIVFQTLILRNIYLYPVCSLCVLTYFLLPSFYFWTILLCSSVFAVKSCLQALHHKLSCPPSGCAIVIITVITRSFEVHVAGRRLMYSGGQISIILSSPNQSNWISRAAKIPTNDGFLSDWCVHRAWRLTVQQRDLIDSVILSGQTKNAVTLWVTPDTHTKRSIY